MGDGREHDIPLAEQLQITLHVFSLPWLQVVLLVGVCESQISENCGLSGTSKLSKALQYR